MPAFPSVTSNFDSSPESLYPSRTSVDRTPGSIDHLREIVADLRAPDARIYFLDVGASALAGWLLFAVSLGPFAWGWRALAFAGCALCMYRALAFIHELFHQQALKSLRHFWHAVVGIPLLLPFLLYLPVHQTHHSVRTYGTPADGEYDQFHGRLWLMVAKTFFVNLFLPPALLIRFGVLTPLSALIPAVRRKVIPAFLNFSLRIPYTAPPIKESARKEVYWVEAACAVVAWLQVGALVMGYTRVLLAWALLVVCMGVLNSARALCSTHLYRESEEGRDLPAQLHDSLNIQGTSLVIRLMCPAGLQYHALHHAAPFLPYHAMAKAHRRLMAQLPADSAYHRSTVDTLTQGWRRVLQATARAAA
jgi:fatty acid desaturase